VSATRPSPFLPPGNCARLAMFFLALTIAFDVVAIESDLLEIAAINRFIDGDFNTASLESSDHRQQIVNVVGFALLAVTAIAFIWWFHAAYRNIAARGTWELRFKSRWAIGAWFVPILAFWRPKQIADDIWRASEPQAPLVDGQERHPAKAVYLLNLWWFFWLVGTFVGNAAVRALIKAGTPNDYLRSDKMDIAALTANLVAAALAIQVVRQVTMRQVTWAQAEGARTV
jgi:hypothetical protein